MALKMPLFTVIVASIAAGISVSGIINNWATAGAYLGLSFIALGLAIGAMIWGQLKIRAHFMYHQEDKDTRAIKIKPIIDWPDEEEEAD